MEFHQLRYFITTAELLSMTRAAQMLHVTQPALSRQIAALEATLGVALFQRVKKRLILSEAGRFFLPRARQILCDAETSAQLLREQFSDAPRTLRLGFLSIFLDDLVGPTLREFRQRHPKARVSLYELTPRAQLDRLRAGELDAAILGNIEATERALFQVRQLSRHPMSAVLAEDHPLARKKVLPLSALARQPWVTLSDSLFPGRGDFLRSICAEAGFQPNLAHEADSLPLLLAAVAAGEGVAIVPTHAKKLPHMGSLFIPLAAPVPFTTLLLVQPKTKPSQELHTLTALLIERAKTMPN